jgi:hypothetical protein
MRSVVSFVSDKLRGRRLALCCLAMLGAGLIGLWGWPAACVGVSIVIIVDQWLS